LEFIDSDKMQAVVRTADQKLRGLREKRRKLVQVVASEKSGGELIEI
jgi:hypothetical protein